MYLLLFRKLEIPVNFLMDIFEFLKYTSGLSQDPSALFCRDSRMAFFLGHSLDRLRLSALFFARLTLFQ